MKIAVLGLGRMGGAIAHRLIDGGHDVTVWNRSRGKAGELLARGAVEASTPAEAASSADVVITSLANDTAVRAVVLGEDGIRSGIGEHTYVDASTVSPFLGAELAHHFQRYVALPVLGAPEAVRSGEATYLAGGPAPVLDDLGPVLTSLSTKVKRYDRPELALAGKLAVNFLLLSGIATLVESITVARSGGLSDAQITNLLCDSPMLAPGLQNRFRGVLEASGTGWWATVLGAKDAKLANEVAAAADHPLRLGPVVHALYEEAAKAGFADDDIVAVASLYR